MINVPCPVCKNGYYTFVDHRGRAHLRTCTACKGTKTLELAPAAYQRRLREMKVFAKPRECKPRYAWSDEEIAIVAKMKTIRQTMDDMKAAGYRRSEDTIKQRRRQIRRERRESISNASRGI